MAAFDFLGWVQKNPDGTITRLIDFPSSPPTGVDSSVPVQSADFVLNSANDTSIRIYRPTNALASNCKLPVVIYFHGGGFVLTNAVSTVWHDLCVHMANGVQAVILSVEYRLSPEYRLPTPYEDAIESILWVKKQAIESENVFLKDVADFSKCYLMGTSAGGNMVYHTALQALNLDLGPMNIVGLIFDQAFFGGVERTGSEIRLIDDGILPLPATDLMWELSSPTGSDRDHEYSNPMLKKNNRAGIRSLPRSLVRGHGGDPLIDRMKELVVMLEQEGVKVVAKFDDGGYHGMEAFEPEKYSEAILKDLRDFMY